MQTIKLFLSIALLSLVVSACANGASPIDESEVRVESIELLTLESFPVQIHAVLKGTLRDGCVQIDDVDVTREGNTFKLTLVTSRLENARCTSERQPFEQTVPLDVFGLPAGTYTVNAGDVSATFELAVDNILEQP